MKRKILIIVFIALFGNGVFPLCAASEPKSSPESAGVIAFKNFLINLDNTKKESILVARDKFFKSFSTATVKENKEAFRIFRGFYQEVIRECDQIFYNKKDCQQLLGNISSLVKGGLENPLPAFEKLNNESSNEIRTKYAAILKELYGYRNCGMNFYQSEGDWYLKEDIVFLIKMFPVSGRNELKDFLIFLNNEDERIAEDAGLIISWDDLRKRILCWEQFVEKHPDFLETINEVKPGLATLVGVYLVGLPNTQAYRVHSTGEIEPKLKKSYEIFLQQNKSSSFYNLISEVYNILKKHNFKINKELVDFLNSQGYNGPAHELEQYLKIIFRENKK